jgi:uncharacterized membrane protein
VGLISLPETRPFGCSSFCIKATRTTTTLRINNLSIITDLNHYQHLQSTTTTTTATTILSNGSFRLLGTMVQHQLVSTTLLLNGVTCRSSSRQHQSRIKTRMRFG